MTNSKLIELSAFAAIAGGALRVVSALVDQLGVEMPTDTFHVPGAEWFFLPTGVLFGAGFVVAGAAVLKSNAKGS